MMQQLVDVKQFLENNLDAAMTHVEGLYGLSVARWRYLDKYQPMGNQFPAIGITPGSTGEYGVSPGNDANNTFSRRFDNVAIAVWHRGNKASAQKVEDAITIYMDALDYLFKNDGNMSAGPGGESRGRRYQFIRVTGTDYTDLFTDPTAQTQGTLLKGAVFNIELRPNY